MLIFDVYTDGEVRQNNGTYSYSYGIWSKYASKFHPKILVVKIRRTRVSPTTRIGSSLPVTSTTTTTTVSTIPTGAHNRRT